jgi:flagellar hook assembly protein FlgD
MVLVMFLCPENQAEGPSTSVDMVEDTMTGSQYNADTTQTFMQHQSQVPKYFEVRQNYPNPFNSSTTIELDLPIEAVVSVDIYNILGQRVRSLEYDTQAPGKYRLEWDGHDDAGDTVASGVYLYVLVAEDYYAIRKMLHLK